MIEGLKMENITIGQIAVALAFLAGLITSVSVVSKHIKTFLTNALQEQLSAFKSEIEQVSKKVDNVDLESCKNYLVTFLSDVEKGNAIDEIEKERFFEQYQHYQELGGNSYIRRKIEQLEAEKRL